MSNFADTFADRVSFKYLVSKGYYFSGASPVSISVSGSTNGQDIYGTTVVSYGAFAGRVGGDSNGWRAGFSGHLQDMEQLAERAIGAVAANLSKFNQVKDCIEPNTRLFPVQVGAKNGKGIWITITNWQTDEQGYVDRGSGRRGKVRKDFKIVPFFGI